MARLWEKLPKRVLTIGLRQPPRKFSNTKSDESSSQYCLELVRRWDYEGYVCSLLIPQPPQRTTSFALRAFNVEVALVAQRVSSASTGKARLLFWKEALTSKGAVPRHPVAQELLRACDRHKLQRRFLQRLVTCRETQLDTPGFPTLSDLEKYAEESVSPVLYLLLQSAGVTDVKVDHAASHLGKAHGLSNVLRALPRARSASELGIPLDLQLKHGLSQETLLRGKGHAKVCEAVFEMATCAKQHLDKARSLSGNVPKEVRALLLSSVPVSRYLELLEKANFDPFHPGLQTRSATLPLHMWWNRLRSRY